MTRPIGGPALKQMFERLCAAEHESLPFSGPPSASAHFRRLGPWLVEEFLLVALLRRRAFGKKRLALPRLADAGTGRMLQALAWPPRWRAACRARAVLAQTHIRAFYLEPDPFTVKLVSPEHRQALAREVEVRAGGNAICAPRLLSYRLDGPQPYLCEELVFGRHPDPSRDAGALIAFALGDLWDTYRANGFEWHRCGESHDILALLKNFDDMTDSLAWPTDWPKKKTLRDALLRLRDGADALIPWCFGHGDLSLGNLLLTEKRIVLLDWEWARRLPLLQELAKITVAIPGAWDSIEARMREELGGSLQPGMLPPRSQAALASLERLAELRYRFSAVSSGTPGSRLEKVRFERRLTAELAHMVKLFFSD